MAGKLAKNALGFTLIELLVVLAVMGVLMGMLGFSVLGGSADIYSGQRQIISDSPSSNNCPKHWARG